LVPDGWREAGEVEGVRLLQAGGQDGDPSLLLAPNEAFAGAVRALADGGAAAFLYVGLCTSPTHLAEPGDLVIVQRARTPEGEIPGSGLLGTAIARRAETHGLRARMGSIASAGEAAQGHDIGQDTLAAQILEAAEALHLPGGAVLVCQGVEGEGSEAPAAVLESFDRLFRSLQEVLGDPPLVM
jgi:hypothetical protein